MMQPGANNVVVAHSSLTNKDIAQWRKDIKEFNTLFRDAYSVDAVLNATKVAKNSMTKWEKKFKKSDTDTIINLWKTCKLVVPWNDPLKDINRKLLIKDGLFIVGESKNRVIASAMAGYDGHRGYIYYLAVLPEFQKQGIGSLILSIVEKKLLFFT